MKHVHGTQFTDRLESQAEAKKALLAKFKPKPAVQADLAAIRAEREAEKERVRQERLAAKEAARVAAEEAEKARQEALLNDEAYQLELQRQARKDRKLNQKAEAQAKREASRALRQQRKSLDALQNF
jgi:hypothetical protein